jgi:N-acyl-phosphatidylethanolamine-hydrolysing phospholipase D
LSTHAGVRVPAVQRRRFLSLLAAIAAAAGLTRWLRPQVPALAGTAGARGTPVRPAHHQPGGGFRNPWPTAESREAGGFLRWRRERRAQELPPDPPASAFPVAAPDVAYPAAPEHELRLTWVGHASFLVQIGGANILTDPHWSDRASPVQFAGPERLVPPALRWEDLPPIHAVLLSHDHYDHLDDGTVRRLHDRFGDGIRWFVPLEYRRWLRSRGVTSVSEMDWWEEESLAGPAGPVRIACLPCQHWTRRTPWDGSSRLWASWAATSASGRVLYFGGDSGYFPGYPGIARRLGRPDAVILPIGAYEPRWFMRPVHMNPEEAVQSFLDLGGHGTFVGMHWGTWRLTDEDPLEPPVRTRDAWLAAGLPPERLRIPRHGETLVL